MSLLKSIIISFVLKTYKIISYKDLRRSIYSARIYEFIIIIILLRTMADTFDNFKLATIQDFKLFALVLAQKLRNPNFLPVNREVFIKTVLEQIRPSCSLKSYEKIEKTLNEIGHLKDLQEKQLKAKLKQQSNVREKKLVGVKEVGRVDKYGVDLDDYESQQQQEDYDEDQEQYSQYNKRGK